MIINNGFCMGSFYKFAALVGSAISIALLFALLLSGCASLPNARTVLRKPAATEETPPTIIDTHKRLTKRRSRAVIEKLKRKNLPVGIMERHLAVEEAISGAPLVGGNKVSLLIDGPAVYAAMFKAIENARDHVNVETFTLAADKTGCDFADLLAEKAAEGVRVNLIYDSAGSFWSPSSFFEHLRSKGVQEVEFNPVDRLTFSGGWPITHRDHRKLLIVDGTLAITGGVNIAGVYSKSPSEPFRKSDARPAWRDTDVQIEGPAVAEFQKLFLDTWKRQNGPELSGGNYFPKPESAGSELVRVIGSRRGEKNRSIYLAYLAAISFAVDSIHLTSAYFIPDRQTIRELTDAAQRGVDVKIVLPAHSDWGIALYAARSHYTRLLESGVKLYERRSAVLHAKTAVIDGVWSSVGSANMDLWSFLRNDEVNTVIFGRDFARQMEAMFEGDIGDSEAISLDKWQRRSLGERIKELLSRSLGYWL
jgi:cardiolipin synthase